IPAKIVNQGLNVTLLDSLQKRVTFLSEVSSKINQDINCIHFRAEDAGQDANYREKFDVATARAVANLTNLCEFCLPFVKVGGHFISLKGFEIEEELEEAKKAISVLGGKIESVEKYQLSDESKRSIIIIKKISQTPTKYPRSFAKMKKQPIK
ncbi:MAG: RsmG family class I SAM-dependent methyltransferase, partial [Oscillospiraceae bacterium]